MHTRGSADAKAYKLLTEKVVKKHEKSIDEIIELANVKLASVKAQLSSNATAADMAKKMQDAKMVD